MAHEQSRDDQTDGRRWAALGTEDICKDTQVGLAGEQRHPTHQSEGGWTSCLTEGSPDPCFDVHYIKAKSGFRDSGGGLVLLKFVLSEGVLKQGDHKQ